MSTDHNETMRLADPELLALYRRHELATAGLVLSDFRRIVEGILSVTVSKQAERIAELQSAHAIAVEIAAQYAAERDQLRAEVALRPWRPISPKRIAALWAEACKPDRPTCDMVEAFVRLIEADHGIDLARTTHKETE